MALRRLEEMLTRGNFDLIAVGRAIANADWAQRVPGGAYESLAIFDQIQARQALL